MVVVGSGPFAVQDLLLSRLDTLLDAPSLGAPIRVIVPSRSLRQHVLGILVRHRRRGVAGVVVQTLFATAAEILERMDLPSAPQDRLFPIIVKQLAAGEPLLRAAFEDLANGYASVGASVADLLDAGLNGELGEALLELLATQGSKGPGQERAQAVVRVALRSLQAFEPWAVSRTSTLLQRAREAFLAEPSRALPARAVLVHGFAEATGLATDLLEAILRFQDGELLLDLPPDPADTSRHDRGGCFAARLHDRLAGLPLDLVQPVVAVGAGPTLCLLRAPGMQAEVRGVVQRARALLDAGTPPESIGIVARDLEPYVTALRTHLRRLAVPFSGLQACAPLDGNGRRVAAVLDLLRLGDLAPVERWLDATARVNGRELCVLERSDLRVALRAHGAARVGEAAGLDPAASLSATRPWVPLPVRVRISVNDNGDGESDPYAERRRLDGKVWIAAIEAVRRLRQAWLAWPRRGPVRVHVERADALLRQELGWTAQVEPLRSLACLRQALPQEFELDREDFLVLLDGECRDRGRPPLGGAGAGVQVLSIMEARARTWEHLFVLGLNRDVFPRVVREDPLIPDSLRRAALTLLPDLPIKEAGYDEEQYLFAQLVSSSRQVTLSWQILDDDGKPRVESTLIERLLAERPQLEPQTLLPLYAGEAPPEGASAAPQAKDRQLPLLFSSACTVGGADARRQPGPRPAHEHAVLGGLYWGPSTFASLLPLALAEVEGSALPVERLARARLAILRELDGAALGQEPRSDLGPYFGLVGPVGIAADPRRGRIFVTTLEGMARCPWRTFLLRLLGLEQVPDPAATLPAVSALMVGSTVHKVLEGIVATALGAEGGTSLEELVSLPSGSVTWPAAEELEQRLRRAAHEVLRKEGIGLPGFAQVLAERARPFLRTAREREWKEGLSAVLGVECEGKITMTGSRTLWFRADRVDRVGAGVGLTDYKTGKAAVTGKNPEKRAQQALERIAAGELLQGPTYAWAARQICATDGGGRYSYLKPQVEEPGHRLDIDVGDGRAAEALVQAVERLTNAWDQGSFFPRLTDDKGEEPRACGFCEVSRACLRGDTQARNRLRRWSAQAYSSGPAPILGAALGVWRMGNEESPDSAVQESDDGD